MKEGLSAHSIIDGHVHLSLTSTQSWQGNAGEMEEMRCQLGFEALCVQNIVLWKTANLPRNPVSLLLKLRYPGTMFSFGGVRYPNPEDSAKPYDYAKQVERLLHMGFDGIKLFAKPDARRTFGQPLDSPVFREMFHCLEEKGAPVLYHVADPAVFWDKNRISSEALRLGWYNGPGTPPFDQFLEELERLLDRHPRLRVVFPHFLFLAGDLPRCSRFLDRYPNARIDITPGVELYQDLTKNIEESMKFFERYQDRIHFGTDNTGTRFGVEKDDDWLIGAERNVCSIRRFLEWESGEVFGRRQPCLVLSGKVLEKIYKGNFVEFVSPKPKVVDPVEAFCYTEKLHKEAMEAGDCPDAVEILQDAAKQIGIFSE